MPLMMMSRSPFLTDSKITPQSVFTNFTLKPWALAISFMRSMSKPTISLLGVWNSNGRYVAPVPTMYSTGAAKAVPASVSATAAAATKRGNFMGCVS